MLAQVISGYVRVFPGRSVKPDYFSLGEVMS